jgi:hypothetical protein
VDYWKTFFRTILRVGLPLLILSILGSLLDQWITSKMEAMLLSPQGTSHMVWFYGALSLIWSLVDPLLGLLLILSTLQPLPMMRFWRQTFPQAMIELMRAWGKAMMWSFLLIIPGLIRFVRYLFVPFVVCLDPAYAAGEREALQYSIALSKGRMWKLFGIFFLSSMLFPAVMTTFDEWRSFSIHPASATLLCGFEMLLNLAFSLWLWKIYQRSIKS